MSRFVKFSLAAALAIVVTLSASDLFGQCCNSGGRVGIRGRFGGGGIVMRVRAGRGGYTSDCGYATQSCGCSDCGQTYAAPACGCGCTSYAAPSCGNCGVAYTNSCGCNTCNTGRTRLFAHNRSCGCGYVSTCNSCGYGNYPSTGCGCGSYSGGCPGCAGQVYQGTTEGGVIMPQPSGEQVAPPTENAPSTTTPPNDT